MPENSEIKTHTKKNKQKKTKCSGLTEQPTKHPMIDLPTNKPTHLPTDTVDLRVGFTRLKKKQKKERTKEEKNKKGRMLL